MAAIDADGDSQPESVFLGPTHLVLLALQLLAGQQDVEGWEDAVFNGRT